MTQLFFLKRKNQSKITISISMCPFSAACWVVNEIQHLNAKYWFLNDLPSILWALLTKQFNQRNKEKNKKKIKQKSKMEIFSPKPNQKFQKVFLANQKNRKKKTSFPLLVCCIQKPSIQQQQSIVSKHYFKLNKRMWIFFFKLDLFIQLMFTSQRNFVFLLHPMKQFERIGSIHLIFLNDIQDEWILCQLDV